MLNPIENRHIGRFRIRRRLINKEPRVVQAIMRNIIVLAAEQDFATDTITYTAIGNVFESVNVNYEVPMYRLAFMEHKGDVAFSFFKEKGVY